MPFLARLFLLLFLCTSLNGYAQTFSITDYGAKADGKTVNTAFIQKAIDACAAKKGGRVYVPAGIFITGTINLKSHVNLYLESGAILQGSANLKDYQTYTLPVYGLNYYGILYTVKADDVSITGMGSIDGNNKVFYNFTKAKKIDEKSTRFTRQKGNYRKVESGIGDGPVVPKDRPRQMVIFSQCKNVRVEHVSLLNSPFWTLHFADCDAVNVSGIKLFTGMLVPNADGIDVTSSSNVTISNCDIRAGDDAIAITGYDHHFEIAGFSGIKKACENIVVTNCNLQSYSSGIRIGFLDQNPVRNVHVSNTNITNSTRGIGIFLRDEGSIENITFSNMHIETHLRTGDWWGNGEPIHISAVRGKEQVKLGSIKNVLFDNITCSGENGILLYGSEQSQMQDIRFQNIIFKIEPSTLNKYAGGNIDLRGALYENEQLFSHDIPGIYARYVNGLSLHNVKVEWNNRITEAYFTHAFQADSCSGLKLFSFEGKASPSNPKLKPLLFFKSLHIVTDIKKSAYTKQ